MTRALSIRLISLLLGPVSFCVVYILFPENIISPNAHKALALAIWMIIWWITEAAPIPVTALLPLIMFPLMGIMTMQEAASPYANPIIFLFMGGFLIAIALEKHRVHERIALNLIKLTGTSGNGIILGFMLATGVLSMWISNTATAMMMLPIAMSVINLVRHDDPMEKFHHLQQNERNFALGLMLSIGYAATLGGLATLIGTPPNVVFKGLLEQHYQAKISFSQWLLVGLPVSITLLVSTYFIVTVILFPNRMEKIKGSDELLAAKLSQLGPVSKTEKRVLIIFLMTSLLWIFQEVINALAGKPILNDSNIAMMGGLLMFVVPSALDKWQFLLDWSDTRQLQWGILILFGGGLCLAQGLQNTGIIEKLGLWIADKSTFDTRLILLVILAGVLLSEVMSNVALVQIFIPVIFGIADGMKVNPILLALPVTLSASIAFMFPIGTPPNAIVFSSGYIRIKDMARAGILLNIFSVGVILLASITLVRWVFGN